MKMELIAVAGLIDEGVLGGWTVWTMEMGEGGIKNERRNSLSHIYRVVVTIDMARKFGPTTIAYR